MKVVAIYILALVSCLSLSLGYFFVAAIPEWLIEIRVLISSIILGGIGGCLYCLRSIYINASVRQKWDKHWEVWYFLRPFVSLIAGGVSYVFLKAGLLVLNAEEASGTGAYGFYAFAIIAGLNVDNFVKRVEGIAQSTWGISPSRSSTEIKAQGKKE